MATTTTGTVNIQTSHNQPGRTRIAFSRDGKYLYTGGADDAVRVWPADPKVVGEPKYIGDATENITWISSSSTSWASASVDSSIRLYNKETDELEGLITRTAGVAARCVEFSPDGKQVAVTSDELVVKLVDIKDNTRISLLEGHKKSVRSASWHPTGALLTTIGADGNLIIWDTSSHPSATIEPLKEVAELVPAADPDGEEYDYEAKAVWHPSGKYFAIPGATHDILFVSRASWTIKETISHAEGGHTSPIISLAFSVNGHYLASGSVDGLIIVWDPTTKTAVSRHMPREPAPPTSIAFSPIHNMVAWSDKDGVLTRWTSPIPSNLPSPITMEKIKDKPKTTAANDAITANKAKFAALFGEDVNGADGGDEDDEDMYDDDWIIDDIGVGVKDKDEKQRKSGGLREMVNVTKAQPAFQPGSTPYRNKKRFLAFNMIGVIEVTDQDTHQIINVEFHDKAIRRGYHFQDHFRFTMASLGTRGAVYATPSQPSTSGPSHASQITYKPYESWASSSTSSSEWQVSLPDGEEAIAVAAGGLPLSASDDDTDIPGGMGWVVAATSKGYVRFFSGAGIQRYLWNLGGDVVGLVAGAEWVFVVHREGGTSLDGCQNLRYTLISLDSFDIIQDSRLPLRKGMTLEWIGISDEGLPAMYDSNGVLSILDRFRRPTQARWVPALDTNTLARRKGKEESYWPVGVSEKEMWCIILKGSEGYPGFPRPLIQEIEVRMPFTGMDAPQGQIEETFLREEIQLQIQRDALPSDAPTNPSISQRELALDKSVITLIQTACKADKLQRALDLTSMLHHLNSYDTAQKVAQFYHLVGLQEKMGMLKRQREKVLGGEGEEERDVRKGWGKVSEPVRRSYDLNEERKRGSTMFQDFLPPPAITRRSLAAAVPVLPSTNAASRLPPIHDPSTFLYTDDSMTSEPDSFSFSAFSDIASKRKRDDDEVTSDVDVDKQEGPSVSKKRPNAENGDSAKHSANPFARKPAPTGSTSAAFNPFARKNGAKAPLNAVKSNSFFEKVDAAENGEVKTTAQSSKRVGPGNKGKGKEAVKQTTLFGLPMVKPVEKEKIGKGKGKVVKEKDEGEERKVDDVDSQSLHEVGAALETVTSQETGTLESQDTGSTQLEEMDTDTLQETPVSA